MDYILNGQATGSVASTLLQHNGDVNLLRPWIGQDGRGYVTANDGGSPKAIVTANANATLRKDEWIELDEAVVRAAKPRLKAVADLRAAGCVYTVPNGMGKTVFQSEAMSDISAATISMDGLRESSADRPQFSITNLPLPIIHKDFGFSMRQIMASRNSSTPIDTASAELAGRRVAEEAEKFLLGVNSVYTYGGGSIYGYTNYTNRITQTITSPETSGWTGATLLNEILSMRSKSQAKYHYGPWMLYNSPDWDVYLDDDYSTAKGDNTLRDRIKKIEGITDVRTLDYMTDYDFVMVKMTSDVVREVIGMDITTVQWESQGGMMLNFKVMAIMVPQIRSDYNGNTGIVHGATDN